MLHAVLRAGCLQLAPRRAVQGFRSRGRAVTEHGAEARPVARARTHTVVVVAIATLSLFTMLLVAGAITRARANRELRSAARTVATASPDVAVIRPERATETDL